METTETHSTAKLALGVFTSPTAAFEEILHRRRLGAAFVMAAIAGTLALVATLLRDYGQGPVRLFALGYANPITWVGLMMVYGLALHYLLKWLGTDSDYRALLTVMGWAQVTLVVSQALGVAEAAVTLSRGPGSPAVQYLAPAALVLNVWYLPAVGFGIRSATDATLSRGILSYLIVHLAAFMGLTYTYSTSRLGQFSRETLGILYAAQTVISADKLPWLVAGFAGIVFGLWHLGKSMEWDEGARMRRVATAAVVGVIVCGCYYYALWKTDYYGQLLTAQRLYQREHYAKAAQKLEAILPDMPGETGLLSLEIADFSFAAGNDKNAVKYYNKALESPPPSMLVDRQTQDAHAHVGLGMVDDIQGKDKAALAQFQKAAKIWKDFREPWSRSAITYARTRNYEKAIESANHAINELKSEAPEAYLGLVQSYAATGKIDKARAAYKKLEKLDKDLAEKIGKNPENWKNATSKLGRKDLMFPLEPQFAKPPERPQPKKALAGTHKQKR